MRGVGQRGELLSEVKQAMRDKRPAGNVKGGSGEEGKKVRLELLECDVVREVRTARVRPDLRTHRKKLQGNGTKGVGKKKRKESRGN